jgi:hypothetical protein
VAKAAFSAASHCAKIRSISSCRYVGGRRFALARGSFKCLNFAHGLLIGRFRSRIKKYDSSEESMGEFWLRQLAK